MKNRVRKIWWKTLDKEERTGFQLLRYIITNISTLNKMVRLRKAKLWEKMETLELGSIKWVTFRETQGLYKVQYSNFGAKDELETKN